MEVSRLPNTLIVLDRAQHTLASQTDIYMVAGYRPCDYFIQREYSNVHFSVETRDVSL